MLGYVTLGMKRTRLLRLFFPFPGEKCCEIVQEQPPVSTLSPASRSFYITRSTVRALSSGVRGRVRRSQRRTRTLPHVQLPHPPLEPIRALGGLCHPASSVIPEGRSGPSEAPSHLHTLQGNLRKKHYSCGLPCRASLTDNEGQFKRMLRQDWG